MAEAADCRGRGSNHPSPINAAEIGHVKANVGVFMSGIIFEIKTNHRSKVERSLKVRSQEVARPGGFEPLTLCFGGTRSIHLSYGRGIAIRMRLN
jgi:hypothetical protein